jgi:hypothetical protein
MTDQEWGGVVAVLTANWPHSLPPEMALRKWRSDVDDLDGQSVLAAVEALYRDGREFPPNGAQIRNKVRELEEGEPADWSAGYHLATHLSGAPREAKFWLHGDGSPNHAALEWLTEQDSIAAMTVKRLGLHAWGERLIADEGMWRANFRDIYRDIAASADRERRYEGLPTSEGRGELHRAAFAEIAEESRS